MRALIERVKKVADGAAMMTETQVEMKVVSAVSNLLGNTPLEQAMQRQLEHLGPPPFDAADRKYAAEIQATLTPEDIASAYARAGVPVRKDRPLCDFIVPYGTKGAPMMGSTDVGDVSWVVPTVQARVATHAIGTPGPFLADHGAGQVRAGQEGHGQRRQGDGGRGGRRARRSRADRARQGRSQGAHGCHALRLPVADRCEAAAPAAADSLSGVARIGQRAAEGFLRLLSVPRCRTPARGTMKYDPTRCEVAP